jgi:hypothetical protein
MKVEVLMNGSIKLVIIAENEIEIAILKQLSSSGVEATAIAQHTQILDKVVQDGLVIKTKSNRAEDLQNPA